MKIKSGFFWSFLDQLIGFFFSFIFGILLARQLSPKDFGLFSVALITISISEIFVNSGLSSALIRKGDRATQEDYSSVFFFNFLMSILIAFSFFYFSFLISDYFNEPILIDVIKVLSFVIILDSLSIIQIVKLTKKLDFKRQASVTAISYLFSGIVGVIMAFNGYGIWSLVLQKVVKQCLFTVMIWKSSDWRPIFIFRFRSIFALFSFGGNLFLSSLVNIFSVNIFTFFIGKNFTISLLGSYNKAQELVQIPSKTLSNVIERVSYPILSNLFVSKGDFLNELKLIVKRSMFLTFISLFSLVVLAEPLVLFLLGEKWESVIPLLQLFCFVNLLYPLHSINLTTLKVLGFSNLFLRLELIKVLFILLSLIIGFFFGLNAMLLSMVFSSVFNLFLNTYWSKKYVNYSLAEQVVGIFPSFLGALIVSTIVYFIGFYMNFSPMPQLFIQLFLQTVFLISYFELFKNKEYSYFKNNILASIKF
jgi:teichuronic acid exporter